MRARIDKLTARWSAPLVGVTVLLGINHGIWHWIVGGILLLSFLLFDAPRILAWYRRTFANRSVKAF